MKQTDLNPFYLEAIEAYLQSQSQKLQSLLESDRLNRIEKELIQARISIRDKDWASAEKRISALTLSTDFYCGEAQFLLGNISGFNANWEQAILHNTQAYQHYDACQNERGLFLATYNLSADYSNLGLFQISARYLLQAQSTAHSDKYKSQIFRGLAWNYLHLGEREKALKALEEGIKLNTESIYPSEKNMLLAVAADVYFRLGKIDETFEIMKGLKFSKSIRDKSRIHFEFKLLEKMKYETRPYRALDFPSEELSLSGEYRLKWNVLRSLLNGEKKMADTYWSQLCFLFPMFYASDYKCLNAVEAKSVFISFLEKVLTDGARASEVTEIPSSMTSSSTKLSALVQALLESPTGMRKEDLIEKIWNQKYDPSMDAKLYKLIQRTREQADFEVITRNQCYHLKKSGS